MNPAPSRNPKRLDAMKPPRKRLTLRALAVITALFAVDFGGIAWVVRHRSGGPHVGDPLPEFVTPVVIVFAPFALLLAVFYRYVPPPWDEVLTVIVILILLAALLLPVIRPRVWPRPTKKGRVSPPPAAPPHHSTRNATTAPAMGQACQPGSPRSAERFQRPLKHHRSVTTTANPSHSPTTKLRRRTAGNRVRTRRLPL